jgi:hypothetical protein
MKAALVASAALAPAAHAFAQPSVSTTYRERDFPLAHQHVEAAIWVDPEVYKVAGIAAGDLAAEIERVTDIRPSVANSGLRSGAAMRARRNAGT